MRATLRYYNSPIKWTNYTLGESGYYWVFWAK